MFRQTFNNRTLSTAALAMTGLAAGPAMGSTVLQYGYDYTTGTVASQGGGVIIDDSGSGNDGRAALTLGDGSGGHYTADIPNAASLQNTTGIGSVDVSLGRHITSTANIFNRADVVNAGGMTIQTWIKPYATSGDATWSGDIAEIIISDGGFTSLLVGDPAGAPGTASDGVVQVGVGVSSSMVTSGFEIPEEQWTHLAAVFSNPVESGTNNMIADLDFYVGGVLRETVSGVSFTTAGQFGTSPPRGIMLSAHPFADIAEPDGNPPDYDAPYFDGLVFEPVWSLGALSASEFTVVPTPGSAACVLAGAGLIAARRRRGA